MTRIPRTFVAPAVWLAVGLAAAYPAAVLGGRLFPPGPATPLSPPAWPWAGRPLPSGWGAPDGASVAQGRLAEDRWAWASSPAPRGPRRQRHARATLCGWPARAAAGWSLEEWADTPAGPLTLFAGGTRLPRPLWAGLALDGAVLGAAGWALVHGPGLARRTLRARAGLCPACGDPRTGLPAAMACPNCGADGAR